MASFRRAVSLGADMLEIDVQATKDGVPIAFHDNTIDRVTDGSGLIQHLTLENTRKLHVGKEVIPTVEEVIKEFSQKNIGFVFDVKTADAVNELKKIIFQYKIENSTIISTFKKSVIVGFEDVKDTIKTGILCWYASDRTLNFAVKYGVDYIHPYYLFLSQVKVQHIKNLGFRINTWTVDTNWAIKRMAKRNVDGIITNRPAFARKAIEKQKIK